MRKIILLFLLIFAIQSKLNADENNYFVMLKYNKVNVRYGPSVEHPIKFIYKKIFLPIKVIDKKDEFRRIIDHKKNSGWIHRSQLKPSKSLIILTDKIIFKSSTKHSKPLAKLQKGRLLIIKKCKINWCKVKTENYSGWIEKKNIWGNIN
mgnify:CR=1 FL=1